ncbi:MAG: DNA polymerase III subunit chi [Burkholderiales bacterium]|jgi:DNA polymerase-3 subunit chi
MTEILFYTNAPDKLRATCQISGKALERKRRVMVLTDQAQATEQLSRLLWSTPSTGFTPHCRATDRLAGVTPVIVDHTPEPVIHEDVLINLRDETPAFFSRFQRLIEIVTNDQDDRARARERFRFYRDRGYEIVTHALGKTRT